MTDSRYNLHLGNLTDGGDDGLGNRMLTIDAADDTAAVAEAKRIIARLTRTKAWEPGYRAADLHHVCGARSDISRYRFVPEYLRESWGGTLYRSLYGW